jgi:hypothetical protein
MRLPFVHIERAAVAPPARSRPPWSTWCSMTSRVAASSPSLT